MMNTVVGMVYFEDYKEMIPWHTVLFGSGVIITLIGVFLLSKRDPTKPPKGFTHLQEEGGYIEEVVSSLDDNELELVSTNNNSFIKDDSNRNNALNVREESDVRQPFIDNSSSTTSLMKGQGLSSSVLNESPSESTEKPKPPDMGDVEDEEEAVGMDTLGDSGPHPIHHPTATKPQGRGHSRSFSLSWSWWARGGTRKLYTPLF